MAEPGFLVVGLGNPGPEYEFSPHNLGFLTVDRVAERSGIRITRREAKALVGEGLVRAARVLLAKPQTFMNLSGSSVKGLLEKYELPLERLLIVSDELNLPWGSLRIRPKGSAGGHNGMDDVIRCLGSQEFARLRLGVHPGHPVREGAKYLLAPVRGGQKKELDELLGRAADAVESILALGVDKAMTMHNRRAQGLNKEEE
jgi:peptidyl-tRNA hydrolase, PTH1 family